MDNNKSLTSKTITGVLWNLTDQFLRMGSALVVTLALGWMLMPEDFGLIAIIAIINSLSTTLINGGMIVALIRKPDLSELDLNTAFTINVIFASLLYFLVFLFTPNIAEFYSLPMLNDIIPVATLVFFFNAFVTVPESILRRKMLFKKQMVIALPASIISGMLAIFLAWLDYGVWALVWQILISSFLIMVFMYAQKIWLPSFSFGIKNMRNLFSFAGYAMLESFLRVMFQRIYLIVIAKLYSVSLVGLYFFANKIQDSMVMRVVASIQNVTFSALSKKQTELENLKLNYRKVVSLTTIMLFSLFTLLLLLTDLLFALVLPEKWAGSVVLLQLMILASFTFSLKALAENVLMAQGKAKLFFYLNVYEKVVIVALILVSYPYGIEAILYGQIVAGLIAYIPFIYFLSNHLNYNFKEQMADILPNLFIVMTAALMAYATRLWLTDYNQWLILFSATGVFLVVLIMQAKLFKLTAYQLIIVLIKQKFSR